MNSIDRFFNKFYETVGEILFRPLLNYLDRRFPDPEPDPDDDSVERREAILKLSLEEAKEQCIPLLSNPSVFEAMEEHANDPNLDVLAPEIRTLMRKYSAIYSVDLANGTLSREDVYRPIEVKDFILIGHERDMEIAVCVRPGQEAIYTFYGEVDDEPEYASVYHWLLSFYHPNAASHEEEKPPEV